MTNIVEQRAASQAAADSLAAAIESRDATKLDAIYTSNATVWHNEDRKTQNREENISHLAAIFSLFSSLKYDDVRRIYTDEGFVQQHVLTGILLDGRSVEIPACLVIKVRDGKIEHIDEYLDPTPFVTLMSESS
jgi:ketosteroid isomerase-like protein